MRVVCPDIYFGKKLRVTYSDGDIFEGILDGYDVTYNENGEACSNLDFLFSTGPHKNVSACDCELERIEIIGDLQ